MIVNPSTRARCLRSPHTCDDSGSTVGDASWWLAGGPVVVPRSSFARSRLVIVGRPVRALSGATSGGGEAGGGVRQRISPAEWANRADVARRVISSCELGPLRHAPRCGGRSSLPVPGRVEGRRAPANIECLVGAVPGWSELVDGRDSAYRYRAVSITWPVVWAGQCWCR